MHLAMHTQAGEQHPAHLASKYVPQLPNIICVYFFDAWVYGTGGGYEEGKGQQELSSMILSTENETCDTAFEIIP